MDPDIEDRVADWPSRTVSDGYDGLRKLADAEFSGAVSLDGTWVFVVGGQVVGIRDGSMEEVEGAAGTAYQAPADALPLLFTMQTAAETEVRGQYYTEETPLREVDSTLGDAGFTGYLELSENVLSGDYYVVYHGGRSRPVAIVGTREEILQGEEAYELAADEVGIYDVVQAPITVTEIPEPIEGGGPAVGGAGGASSQDATEGTAQVGNTEPESDRSDRSPDVSTATATQRDQGEAAPAPPGDEEDAGGQAPDSAKNRNEEAEPTTVDDGPASSGPQRVGEAQGERDSGAAADRSPSIESSSDAKAESPDVNGNVGESDSVGGSPGQPTGGEDSQSGPADSAADADESSLRRRVETLEEELEREHERAESLASERTDIAEELEALKDELGEVEAERDELTERVRHLEAQLAEHGDPASDERTDRPFREAMQETNLFVRYETRSEPTLKDLQQELDRDRLRDNLEVEVHTAFDRTTVSIDGVPFEEALRSSPEWAFVHWLVRDLPFEIRDTAQTEGLRGLMDAMPDLDRIDLQSAVDIAGSDQETEAQVDFDVILRNKTGAPLVVADIHHGREPVRGDSIDDLLGRSGRVVSTYDELGAAFAISPSFFSPDALEAAQGASSSGFLSRDSRLSYVKTDRSQGYHLCLVEGRGDAFHVTVPEL